MVELSDDSKGKSALLSGAEARAWKFLAQDLGLVDAYLCAVTRAGGSFTRYAFHGKRYDQAMLDRLYITSGADWLHLIKQVTHHTDQTVSDHVPMSFTYELTSPTSETPRPKTYFKMDPALLRRPGIIDKLQTVREDHPSDAGNPQQKWQLATEYATSSSRNGRYRSKSNVKRKIIKLSSAISEAFRVLLSQTWLSRALQRIHQLEHSIRVQDQMDAKAWRLRSKNRWLKEGEAPSRYISAQLRAKNARENIKSLFLQDGTKTTDPQVIMAEVQDYYKVLYTAEEENQDKELARQQAFATVDKQITPAQNRVLANKPDDREIDSIAKLMKNDKSPGLDGVTTEFLIACWSFIRTDCISMIHHFWEHGQLIKGATWGQAGLPYLFALCTQVLISMLKTQQVAGTIAGLKINAEDSLLYQLFADDTCLFLQMDIQVFENTRRVLANFETASGAKLNLNKTLVMPLRRTTIPGWLQQTECTIAALSDRFRYLGILAGTDVLEEEILTQLQQRLAKVIISDTVSNSNKPVEVKSWDPTFTLFAIPALRIHDSPVLDRMLKTWCRIKKKITWNPDEAIFPTDTSPRFAAALLDNTRTLDPHQAPALIKICRTAGIRSLR
ncbi:hypothetical protein R1sor_009057 [Riccia sorocarpa]|uniref:Reverse transcriptase domain-containing protein n=1 Tax=Riccia sorocarpa TaxID=122646 RepID=A0ABD3H5A4_9MARC